MALILTDDARATMETVAAARCFTADTRLELALVLKKRPILTTLLTGMATFGLVFVGGALFLLSGGLGAGEAPAPAPVREEPVTVTRLPWREPAAEPNFAITPEEAETAETTTPAEDAPLEAFNYGGELAGDAYGADIAPRPERRARRRDVYDTYAEDVLRSVERDLERWREEDRAYAREQAPAADATPDKKKPQRGAF